MAEQDRWLPEVTKYFASVHEDTIHHLEGLKNVFGAALKFAGKHDTLPVVEFPLRAFIDNSGA